MRQWLPLLALLLLLAGCTPRGTVAPDELDSAMLRYDPADLEEAAQVAFVTHRKTGAPSGTVRPLYGDREADRPGIAHLLHLLRRASPTAEPVGIWRSDEDLQYASWLVIRYRDGREVRLHHVERALGGTRYEIVKDRLYHEGVGEVIAPDLAAFYHNAAPVGRRSLLPPVSPMIIEPSRPKPGGPITVRGEGWVESERVAISLAEAGEAVRQPLGEARVERGAFEWKGSLPADLTPGVRFKYAIALEVDGVQTYRSVIQIDFGR
ncbi:MAG: hypothetical protein ACOY93_21090 [Bacillota bacterium]